MLISDTKNKYTDKITHLMRNKWNVEIDDLIARIRQAGAQEHADYHIQINGSYRKIQSP